MTARPTTIDSLREHAQVSEPPAGLMRVSITHPWTRFSLPTHGFRP